MHFYTKEAPFGTPSSDFYHGDALKSFNFFYFAHSDHHETFKELLSDKKRRYALFDLTAAYAAQLQYREMLNLEVFAELALRYFKLGLQARRYTITAPDELRELSRRFKDTIVLVTGCQTPEVRNARVKGAYEAVKFLDVPLARVVLSGAHPSTDPTSRVRSEKYPIEPDEAGAMNVFIHDLYEQDEDRPTCQLQFHKESTSTKTSENIRHFFENVEFDKASRNHLLVSSSAFHLPRICDELEIYLRDENPGIHQITLIQAEHLSVDPSTDTLRHQIYVKQMTYELFRMIFTHVGDRLDDLFKRETSLKV